MIFPVYDFDISTYRNIKKMYDAESIAGTRKASVLKEFLGDAEVTPKYNDGKVQVKIGGTTYLIDGEAYYNYLNANNMSPQLPTGSERDNALDLLSTNVIPSELQATLFKDAHGVKSYEAGTSGSNKVIPNSVNILEFIKEYQLTHDTFQMTDPKGEKISIAATREWIFQVRANLLADEGTEPGMLYFNADGPLSNDSYYLNRDQDELYNVPTNTVIRNIRVETASKAILFYDADYSKRAYAISRRPTDPTRHYILTYSGEEELPVPAIVVGQTEPKWVDGTFYPAADIKEPDTSGTVDPVMVPLFSDTESLTPFLPGKAVDSTRKVFSTELVADSEEEYEYYMCRTLEQVNSYLDTMFARSHNFKIAVADAIPILDMLIDVADQYMALLAANAYDALNTPTGKLFSGAKEVEGLLLADISRLNEMWLHYRISNIDRMNTIEDTDLANDREAVEYLFKTLPEWYKYLYPIVRGYDFSVPLENYSLNTERRYYVLGYAPNWKAMLELPQRHFMLIMQTMGQKLEYGVPKPKKSWGKIIFTIIVVIVITVVTVGAAGAAAASAGSAAAAGGTAAVAAGAATFTGVLAIIGGIASIAGILTGSKTWAKVGMVASVVTMFTGIKGALDEAIKKGLTASVTAYALKLVLMAQEFIYSKRVKKLEGRLETTTEEVEEIEELVTGVEQAQRIAEFIYSDNYDATYTYAYDYRYEWKYLS